MEKKNSKRAVASLSMDLDNKWSYLKTHGDQAWERYPSYLDRVVPRIQQMLDEFSLRITVFVVGQDAALDKNDQAIAKLVQAGHEIANHSFSHEPWLQRYSREQLELELEQAEAAIARHTTQRPIGFRGPGFSCSPDVIKVLMDRGYQYDCSTFPTFLGPLARAYFFLRSSFNAAERAKRKNLFGSWLDGFQRLKPYYWSSGQANLLEIPVSTIPLFRLPFHLSYVLYLGQFSEWLALTYFGTALRLCRLAGVQPSVLLHPLDFLGCDDEPELGFFPAMNLPSEKKLRIVRGTLKLLTRHFEVVSMAEHAQRLIGKNLPRRELQKQVHGAASPEVHREQMERV
jgi:hypothetical protein